MVDRENYFIDKCALLNPDAYEYIYATNWTRTVPVGETWYALNLWYVNINGVGPFFHRHLHVDEAVTLPAGTVISASGPQKGFAYLCKPSLVTPPSDPEPHYFSLLAQIKALPLFTLKTSIPAGSPPGTYTGASMPTDFQNGYFNYCSTHDLCWTIIVGNYSTGGGYDSMNTLTEISDNHTIRFTGKILCPFKRNRWNGIWGQAGSISGNYSEGSLAGTGILTYQKIL